MLSFDHLRSLNRVNENMAPLEVIPEIKIHSTPYSGLGKLLTLTGYINGLT